MELKQDLSGKISRPLPETLLEILSRTPRIAVAFSGGLDSRYLCRAASLAGADIIAIHATGPHVSPRESEYARTWAKTNGVLYHEIRHNPLALPEVARNGRSRCYECKKSLLKLAREVADEFGGALCDGGNADDFKVYRPGLRAVAEAGVVSPLALAGMGKKEIRESARDIGLEWPDQKARPCLLTRYAYGLAPDAKTLRRLAIAEAALEQALDGADFRLRLKPEPELQTDRDPAENGAVIREILEEYGLGNAEIKILERVGGYYDRAGQFTE